MGCDAQEDEFGAGGEYIWLVRSQQRDIMALQVARINAHRLLQTVILLPVLGGETTCHGSGSFQNSGGAG